MRSLLLAFLLVCPFFVSAQDFNYVHYDTKEGLAGSTVYHMCEDVDGFMWFATTNGISRFDGTNFTNFTVRDGLPDNEVLRVFPDSKGRVWFGTFSKEISFYYKGKIYNNSNLTWLSKVKLVNAALSICEDENGRIMISDMKNLFLIGTDHSVTEITKLKFIKAHLPGKIFAVPDYFKGGFFINLRDTLFRFNENRLIFFTDLQDKSAQSFVFKMYPDGTFISKNVDGSVIYNTTSKHSSLFVGTTNGGWSIDTSTLKFKDQFLPGKKVSHVLRDKEGNLWFSTLGEGVYRLPNLLIRNILFPDAVKDVEVFSLSGWDYNLICGLGYSKVAIIRNDTIESLTNYEAFIETSLNNSSMNKLYTSEILTNGDVIFGFDAFLISPSEKYKVTKGLFAIKSIDQIDNEFMVVGAHNNAYKVSISNLRITDTIFRGRVTKVFYKEKIYYIGTLTGLYEVNDDKEIKHLKYLHPALGRRITGIVSSPDGTLWIATNDAGVVGYREGKIVGEFQDDDGLSSNICKALFLNNNYLFVGTNKGLNKIDLLYRHPILKYSASDGLPSDIINALYVNDSIVYIGTPKGLTYFNEQEVSNHSICNLKILNVSVSGKSYTPSNSYIIPYDQNNISFEFVAISYKSGGDIKYHYKLNGLDTAWQTTEKNNLVYQTLPYGNYSLQLYAVNKFGVVSDRYTINFLIETPFWRTGWAFVVAVLLFVTLTALIFGLRNKAIQKKLIEKNNLQKQFAALEQQALQAQMNPHFIFNCLNSIQQYMLTNDTESANQYLTGFASLIRQTLYISGKQSIKVAEEVQFLSEYLDMEKMRFGDSFEYEIVVDATVEVDMMELPALLLQPFVENCLRHGIRHKQDGTGHVSVSFKVIDDILFCRIRDNGIGRSKAALYKSKQHIEYQSKGMSLTEKRVDLINKMNDQKLSIDIIDLKDEFGNDSGTEVIVQIPV